MRLPRKLFDRMVEEAIASLPEEFAAWIQEVPVIVEDRPGKADRDPLEDPEEGPLGLYVGSSRVEGLESGGLPPRVMIYRQPLMDACQTREELAEEVWKTLVHELGHHAGLSEEDLSVYERSREDNTRGDKRKDKER